MDNSEVLLVPHERIGAIIGKKGSTKREIEQKTKTKLSVDSKEGEVEIFMKGTPMGYLKAMRIVKAIARGFSPENAFKLLNDECFLEIIEIEDIVGKNKSNAKAKKGRVIGSHGKAREEIEKETGTNISVYGKTIGIIGKEEEMGNAKKAVELLLKGAAHSTAMHSLKKDFAKDFEL